MPLLSFVSFINCYVKLITHFIKIMSENMSNVLKENANIEVNEKQFIIFPASQIKVRFFVECTSVNVY